MKRIVILAVVVLLLLAGCGSRVGSIEPGGDLSISPQADGTRLIALSPGDSIAEALRAAQPGDVVLLRAGVFSERIEVDGVGGTVADPVVLRGEENAALDGQGEIAFGLFCTSCRYIVVEGLEVRNFTDIGVGFSGGEDIIIRDLLVLGNGHAPQLRGWEVEGYGIMVENAVDAVIEDNEVANNGPHPKTRRFPMGTGIDVFDCTSCRISGNTVHQNVGGMLVEDCADVLVEDNEVYANDVNATDVSDWWDAGLWVDGGRDVIVRGNVFRDNLGPAVQISDEDDQHPTGYVLENNVMTDNWHGLYVWGFGADRLPGEDVLRLTGNTSENNSVADIYVAAGWDPPPGP